MVRISLLIPSIKCSPFCPIKALSGPPALAGVFKRSEYVHSIFFSEPSEGSKARRACPEQGRRARARDLIHLFAKSKPNRGGHTPYCVVE